MQTGSQSHYLNLEGHRVSSRFELNTIQRISFSARKCELILHGNQASLIGWDFSHSDLILALLTLYAYLPSPLISNIRYAVFPS